MNSKSIMMSADQLLADPGLNALVDLYMKNDKVEAVALGGSFASGSQEAASDYDLYVYVQEDLSLQEREEILKECCSYLELNHQFWETGDYGTLKNGRDVDIMYRRLPELKHSTDWMLSGHANNAYTTCFWDNLLRCKVLADKTGALSEYQKQIDIEYPEDLRQAILHRSRLLLSGLLSSYDIQIKKALQRRDLPSISHRTAAFLESYFDMLYAINKIPHPGEKRMMEKLQNATLLPENFNENLETLFASQYHDSEKFWQTLQNMIAELDRLMEKEGLTPALDRQLPENQWPLIWKKSSM